MSFHLLEEYSATSIIQEYLIAQLLFRPHQDSDWHLVEIDNLADMVNGTQQPLSFYHDTTSSNA